MEEQERAKIRVGQLETFLGKPALTRHAVNFDLLDFINSGLGTNTLPTGIFVLYSFVIL